MGASLVDLGNKGEASAKRVQTAGERLTAQLATQAQQVQRTAAEYENLRKQQDQVLRALAEQGRSSTTLAAATIQQNGGLQRYREIQRQIQEEMERSDAIAAQQANSFANVGQAAEKSGLTIRSLRSPLATLATQFTGVRSSVGQFTSILATLGVGSEITIGVLAGIAILGAAWDALTEKMRKATKAANDAYESLVKAQRQKALGAAADIKEQLFGTSIEGNDGALAKLQEDQNKLDQMKRDRHKQANLYTEDQNEARIILLQNQVDAEKRVIDNAKAAIHEANLKATQDKDATYAQDLAHLVAYGQASAAVRAKALAVYRDDIAKQATLAKSTNPKDIAAQAALGDDVHALQDALFPKKDAQRATTAASDLNRIADTIARMHQEAASFGKENSINQRVQSVIDDLNRLEKKYPAVTAQAEAYKASVRSAGDALKQASYDKVASDIKAQYDAQRALNAAQLDGNGALQAASQSARADAEIRKQELALGRSLADQEQQRIRGTIALQDALTEAQGTASLKAQADAIRAENDALRSGASDRETYLINKQADLAIDQAKLINDPQQRANRLAEIEDLRQANLEHARLLKATKDHQSTEKQAQQATQQRLKQLLNEMQRSVATFFENVFTKGIKSFNDLFGEIKTMFLRLLAEMLAAKFVQKVAGVVGGLLGGLAPAVAHAQAGGSPDGTGGMSAGLGGFDLLKPTLGGVGSALGGFSAGYGIGAATGSRSIGALGGAATGALIGNSILPGIGAAIGGITGFVGGLFGAGHAAKEAARQMRDLQASLAISFAAYKAQINGDQLGQALAQAQAGLKDMLKQIDAAYSGKKNEVVRNQKRAEAEALEAKQETDIRAQYADQVKAQKEDYQVRYLRASGQTKAADDMEFALQQQREYAAAVKAGADAQTLAALQQAQAAEKAAHAIGTLNSEMTNVPQGYKAALTRFNATTGITPGTDTVGPLVPTVPTPIPNVPNPGTIDQSTTNVTLNIDTLTTQAQSGKDLLKEIATELNSNVGGTNAFTLAIKRIAGAVS